MSNKIDQKKYLKKYLSSGKSDTKSRKSSKDSYSGRSRVKIVDDDVDITKKSAGDDYDDLILTGEDAPQIVGIIDDRPPELRTIEDFKNSSKWKSLSKDQTDAHQEYTHRRDDKQFRNDTDRNHKNGHFEKEQNYSASRRDRRSRSNDLSPQRRKWGASAEKDYSPVRRARNDGNEGTSHGRPWGVPTKRSYSPTRQSRDDSKDISPTRKRKRTPTEKDYSPVRRVRNDYKDNSPPRKTWNAPIERDYSPARRNRNDCKEVSPPRKYRSKDNQNTRDDAYCSMKRKDRSFPEQNYTSKRNPFRANSEKNTNISGTNNYNREQKDERIRSNQDCRLSSLEEDSRREKYVNKANIQNPFRTNAPKVEDSFSSRRDSENSGRNSSSDRSNPFRKKAIEASISTEDSLSRFRNPTSHNNFKQIYHQSTETNLYPKERIRTSTSTDDSFKHRYPRSELQYTSKLSSHDTSYNSYTKEVAKFNPFRNQSTKLNDNVTESKIYSSNFDTSSNRSRDYTRSSLKSEIIEPRNRQESSYSDKDVSKNYKPEYNKNNKTDNYDHSTMRKPTNTIRRIPEGEFSNERFNNRSFDNNMRSTVHQEESKIEQLHAFTKTDERKSSYFSTDSRNVYRKSRWDDGASSVKDLSPVRRRQNEDLSPVRRHKARGSDERKKLSPPKAKIRRSRSRDRLSVASNSHIPVKNEKMKNTLDGKTAGLQDAKMLRQEVEALRKEEDERFNQLPAHISGKNADVVVREKRYVKGKDYEKDKEKEKEKAQRNEEKKRVYTRWGMGLKQIEDHKSKIDEEIHESNKPLARYSNDADLDELLKQQERLDDPMLEYMRQKNRSKLADGKTLSVPKYAGSFPENRFNIRPGYRWDGVDRSNGYEKKWFDVQNQKKALQEEAYKYSTEDM